MCCLPKGFCFFKSVRYAFAGYNANHSVRGFSGNYRDKVDLFPPHHFVSFENRARAKQILKKIEAKKLDAAISTQVLSEVAGVLYNKYKVKDTTSQLNAILSYPIDIYIVHPDTIRVAAEYARDYGITPYDGIHIALAVENSITDIISADKELDKVDLIRRIDPTKFKNS